MAEEAKTTGLYLIFRRTTISYNKRCVIFSKRKNTEGYKISSLYSQMILLILIRKEIEWTIDNRTNQAELYLILIISKWKNTTEKIYKIVACLGCVYIFKKLIKNNFLINPVFRLLKIHKHLIISFNVSMTNHE